MKVDTMTDEPIRPGYKRTEVGVIPKDWEVGNLGTKTVKVGSGLTPTGGSKVYKAEGRPFLRSQNVGWGRLILDDIVYIDDKTHNTFPATELHDDDVLLNITGASIGRSAVADHRVVGGNVNQHVCIIRTERDVLNPHYLNYFLLSQKGQEQIDSFQAGGNRQGLNFGQIRSFKLACPLTSEQCAIAEVLSDVDTLLDALDRLIAKKRAIKQGAMQALLTGRVRLPEFTGEWQTKRIRDLLDYERPDKYIVQTTEYGDVGTPVLTANKSFVLGYTDEDFGIYTNLPVIVFDDFTTDSKFADFPFKVKSSAIKLLKSKNDQTNLRYMFERMKLINFSLGDHKRYYISEYQDIEIPVPDRLEQDTIAEVLSDMDAEIGALERRRAKLRDIKQGMMQELLTGRIRLVQLQEQAQEAHV